MLWSNLRDNRDLLIPIITCIVIISSITILVELTKYIHKIDLSNNITISVEIMIGISVAILFYKFSRRENKLIDEKIKNIDNIISKIHDIAKTLVEFTYEQQAKKITDNINNLESLISSYNIIDKELKEIKLISSPNRDNVHLYTHLIFGELERNKMLINNTDSLRHSSIDSSANTYYDNVKKSLIRDDVKDFIKQLENIIKIGNNLNEYLKIEEEKFEKLVQKCKQNSFTLREYKSTEL